MSDRIKKRKFTSKEIINLYNKWKEFDEKTEDKTLVPPFLKCTVEMPEKQIKSVTDKAKINTTYYFDFCMLTKIDTKSPTYELFSYDFGEQIMCSNPKLPPKSDVNTAKYMNVKFYNISDGRIFVESDHKKTESQTHLIANNAELIQVLTLINEEFDKCIDRIASDNAFRIRIGIPKPKPNTKSVIVGHSFCQTERKKNDKDNTNELTVPLEHALYSARISAGAPDKTFGFKYEKDTNKVTPLLYDLKKMIKLGSRKDIACTYTENNMDKYPNITNINNFLTWRSIIMGHSHFGGVYSSQGLSIHWNMDKIYVLTHRKTEPTFDQEKMNSFLANVSDEALLDFDGPDNGQFVAPLTNPKKTVIEDEDNQIDEPGETEIKQIMKTTKQLKTIILSNDDELAETKQTTEETNEEEPDETNAEDPNETNEDEQPEPTSTQKKISKPTKSTTQKSEQISPKPVAVKSTPSLSKPTASPEPNAVKPTKPRKIVGK